MLGDGVFIALPLYGFVDIVRAIGLMNKEVGEKARLLHVEARSGAFDAESESLLELRQRFPRQRLESMTKDAFAKRLQRLLLLKTRHRR